MALEVVGKIGAIKCHGWSGTIAAARNVVDVYTRPGVDLSGFQVLHRRAPQSRVVTATVCTSVTEAEAAVVAAEKLVGTLAKITDPLAREWASVRVDEAAITISACRGASAKAGTQAAYRVDVEWTLEAQE